MMSEHITDDMLTEHRRENFAVEVTQARTSKHELLLSVTHNGSQWTSINLLPDEAQRVIAALATTLAGRTKTT
jgi:hypothetical protein